MLQLAAAAAAAPLVIALYAFVIYPLILWIAVRAVAKTPAAHPEAPWPSVTITVPVYNAEGGLRAMLERLLQLDYPRDKLQLLVISDASTDGTDAIAREFEAAGVELLRLPERRGKTTAENRALAVARGEIIVNADATVLVAPEALKALVRAFDDPSVGVSSGRDRSVGEASNTGTSPESRYVGYEMWLRDLETKVGSIVGASGCFYAIRRCIHSKPLPGDLSWDFASALVARQQGYRAVSVPSAVCIVPRTAHLRTELKRKVRTMARGLRTLFYLRALMNPFRYGRFAWMLISHKLLRWVPFLLAPISLFGLGVLAFKAHVALALLFVAAFVGLMGVAGIRQRGLSSSRPVALAGFIVAACTAGFLAWYEAVRRSPMSTWEPTPRPELQR